MSSDLLTQFSAHHRRLDEAFLAAHEAVQKADWARAPDAFQTFRDAIEKHMGIEEAHLFPTYEQHHGADNALTGILRKGHRDLRGFFEEIAETISAKDGDEADALMGTVAQILSHHDEKEEQEFYPAVAPLMDDPQSVIALLA